MDFRIVNKCLTTIFDVIECIVYIDVDISETHTQREPIKYSIVIKFCACMCVQCVDRMLTMCLSPSISFSLLRFAPCN